jgi:putative ABC transport system permease protein
MTLAFRLVVATFRQHPVRIVLASYAVIAAACVVVWVVSGYDALLAQFDSFSDEYLGRYELFVVPHAAGRGMTVGGPEPEPLPAELVSMLSADAAVAAIDPIMQTRVKSVNSARRPPLPTGEGRGEGSLRTDTTRRTPDDANPHANPLPKGEGTRPGSIARRGSGRGAVPELPFGRPMPTLVGTNAPSPPYEMTAGNWMSSAQSDRLEGVLSSRTAEQLGVGVGDELIVESGAGKFHVAIVGIVEEMRLQSGGMRMPAMPRGPATSALYVPVAAAEKIAGRPAKVNCISIDLHDDADAARFRSKWSNRLADEKIAADLLAPGDIESELAEGFSAAGMRKQAYSATGISLLAAMFIIFTTLSMGVHERSRQFAVLRAVALTRSQAALVVVIESLFLALVGWLGGLLAGWLLLELMSSRQPGLFTSGATIGPWAVALSGICAFGGALAAAVLPAWRVTRISPLEAMTSRRIARPATWSTWAVVAGCGLIAVNPLLIYVVPVADEARVAVYAAVGYAAMAVGFVLLAPLAVLLTERFLGPVVASLLRLDRRFLQTQLSSNLWRTLGTTAALTLGLGLYAATQIWGYSMLQPFVPGDWVPDVLVSFPFGGLPDAEIASVRQVPGVNAERCLPLAVEQPQLAEDLTHSAERQSVTRQDNIVLVGLDPTIGLDGDDPLVDLEFIGDTRDAALARLKQGHGCLIPDHFARAAGLAVGDRFALKPPSGKPPVEYTVAGVVSLPGWHWMTKFSGLRRRSGRSAALVFASFDDVRRDFDLDKINFFWMDIDSGTSIDQVGAALKPIADRNSGEEQPVNAQGQWAVGALTFGPGVRISTPDEVRRRINARADGMIWGMSQLPLFTLAVASLGVVNAVLASVRARRWEIGVLRAVGLTRFGLCRLILAEAVLIGLVACVLSLAFGVAAGWCGTGVSQHLSFFGGLQPPLVLPWSNLLMAFGAALALCLLAALWPAVAAGRTEPLKLLQLGRAAM